MLGHIKNKNGFVILFAVTLAALLLTISLGISNIAFRELRFSTNARDTNDAFFAADTGIECALFHDRADQNKFPIAGPAVNISCTQVDTVPNPPSFSGGSYSFAVVGLGSAGMSCAQITVTKTATPLTTIVSKGYNNGGSNCVPGANSIEREIKVTY